MSRIDSSRSIVLFISCRRLRHSIYKPSFDIRSRTDQTLWNDLPYHHPHRLIPSKMSSLLLSSFFQHRLLYFVSLRLFCLKHLFIKSDACDEIDYFLRTVHLSIIITLFLWLNTSLIVRLSNAICSIASVIDRFILMYWVRASILLMYEVDISQQRRSRRETEFRKNRRKRKG